MIVGVIQGQGASSGVAPSLVQLSDVAEINTFLQANAGETINIFPAPGGHYAPNFLEAGTPINVPAGTTLQACGKVTIRSNNPTRPVFNLGGDGAQVIGEFDLVGNYTRPNFSWLAGEYTSWATAWNAANPAYAIADWLTVGFKDAWNAANDHTQITALGPLSGANRSAAITSYDADNIVIDGLSITNFHTCITLQGTSVVATSSAQTDDMQTSANRVVNITMDQFDFGLLYRKQRDLFVDNLSTEWIGHRVNKAQPHVVYATDQSEHYEESWNVNLGTVYAYNYEGGCVVKTRGQKNFTWDAIICRSVHSALTIGEGTTGAGGAVLVEDQHTSTDDLGAGRSFAIAVVNSPGFLFDGAVRIQQRADDVSARGVEVESSDGVRFLQGIEVECSRPSSDGYMHRVRSSVDVYSGPQKFTDLNDQGILIWSMSDSQEEGGNASNCVLEFEQVTGTTRLAKFIGLSSDNQVWADPSKVSDWDPDLALVDEGLGGGNLLIDPRETVKKVMEVSASTDLSLKAFNALTIAREGPDPLDEDALPPPYLFSNNDTITIGSTTYTWKTTLTGAANEVKIPDAALVTAYPTMTAEYGYLQIAFLNAAIMGTTYKTAGAGVIYGTGTATNTQVESEWGGNQTNLRALASGTAGNSIACSVSMTGNHATWADGTTSDNLTGGGSADNSLLNQTINVTASTSDLTMTLPNSAPDGSFIEFVMVDQAGGSVAVQTSSGTVLGYIYQSNYPAVWRYTTATGWRVDQKPGVYDFNLNGAKPDATTDVSTLWATALATAAVEKLTIRMWGGSTGYYIPTAPGSVINAAVSNIKSVTYDWISLEAVGGPVTILCGIETTAAAAAAGRGASTKAFLKANSSTGGTFQLKGTFIIDGGKDQGLTTFSTFTGADVNAAASLEVTGYDQVLFDDLRVKNTYGNADMRADPDGAFYNATNNPLGSLYKGGLVMDDNGLVKGKLTVASVWREGPFITASNVRRELEFEYVNDKTYAQRNPVSSPLNLFGRQKGSSGTLYGPVDADTYSYVKIGAVSGPWKGSLINVGWSGDLVLEGTSEVTGLVPTTTVANDTASATQYGPGIDCSSEVNFGISRSVELRGLRFRDNHRYSISLARTSSSDKIRRVIGDVSVRGGWSGPNIQFADFLDLVVRCYDCCDYTNAGDYGTALRLYNVGAGDVRIELDGSLQVGAAKSYIGMDRRYSDCVVRGRIKDFYLCCIYDNNVAGMTDNTYNSLYGDMEVVTSIYTTASDGGAIVRIGRQDDNRVKRAEIGRARLDGVPFRTAVLSTIYAAEMPDSDTTGPLIRNITGVNYYPCPGHTFGTGTKVLTPDTLYLLGWDGNLKTFGIGIEVTAAVALSSLRVGLYQGTIEGGFAATVSSVALGTLIEESGAISTTSTGNKNLTWSVSRRRLKPNMFLALVASHGITVRAYTPDIPTLQRINGVAAVTDTTGITHWTGSHTFGALPTTIPTMTGQTSDAPMVYVRRGT